MSINVRFFIIEITSMEILSVVGCFPLFQFFLPTKIQKLKQKISKEKKYKISVQRTRTRIIWTFCCLLLLFYVMYVTIHILSMVWFASIPSVFDSIDHKPLWSKYLPPLSQVICFVIFHWKMHLPSIIFLQSLQEQGVSLAIYLVYTNRPPPPIADRIIILSSTFTSNYRMDDQKFCCCCCCLFGLLELLLHSFSILVMANRWWMMVDFSPFLHQFLYQSVSYKWIAIAEAAALTLFADPHLPFTH